VVFSNTVGLASTQRLRFKLMLIGCLFTADDDFLTVLFNRSPSHREVWNVTHRMI